MLDKRLDGVGFVVIAGPYASTTYSVTRLFKPSRLGGRDECPRSLAHLRVYELSDTIHIFLIFKVYLSCHVGRSDSI